MSRTNGPENRDTPPEQEAREFAEQTGYQDSRNQGRHEPMPASRHDERRQEAVVRNEEHNDGQVRATPSRVAQTKFSFG